MSPSLLAQLRGFAVRHRIPLGFFAMPLFVLTVKPTFLSLGLGAPMALFGLAFRTAASGSLRKNKALARHGLYRLCRNPLYFGSFVLLVGFTVMGGRWIHLATFPPLFLFVYDGIIQKEEIWLATKFPEEFPSFLISTPRFFPHSLPWTDLRRDLREDFQWQLVFKHREYEAWIGALSMAGLLGFLHYLNWRLF